MSHHFKWTIFVPFQSNKFLTDFLNFAERKCSYFIAWIPQSPGNVFIKCHTRLHNPVKNNYFSSKGYNKDFVSPTQQSDHNAKSTITELLDSGNSDDHAGKSLRGRC